LLPATAAHVVLALGTLCVDRVSVTHCHKPRLTMRLCRRPIRLSSQLEAFETPVRTVKDSADCELEEFACTSRALTS